MELYKKVRLACAEGMSARAAAKHFNVSRGTVEKMLAFSVPPGYRRDKPVVLMCYGGNRSARAFEHLAVAGFTRVIDFTPGYETYARQRGGDYTPEKGSCDCPK